MTREDLIKLAKEAGIEMWPVDPVDNFTFDGIEENLARFAKLVAAAEREACARLAEEVVTMEGYEKEIAESIRARST